MELFHIPEILWKISITKHMIKLKLFGKIKQSEKNKIFRYMEKMKI